MDRPELLRLLRRSHDEIAQLRRERDELSSRAHAYDTVAILARRMEPEVRLGGAVDVAWELRTAVEQIERERDQEKEATNEVDTP